MIITYDKFPILGALVGKPYPLRVLNGDEFVFSNLMGLAVKCISKLRNELLNNVVFISTPYARCVERSLPSFQKLIRDPECNDDCGIIIQRSVSAKCYNAIVWIMGRDGDITLFHFYDCDTLIGVIKRTSDGNLRYTLTNDEGLFGGLDRDTLVSHSYALFMGWYHMERYAKVEIVECKGNTKVNTDNPSEKKINNMTDVDIIYRDCTWFRTICRNEGFNVRGHFRLQPKKINGEWTKELIYINEFQKNGYHRQAKILTSKG